METSNKLSDYIGALSEIAKQAGDITHAEDLRICRDRATELEKELAVHRSQPIMTADEVSVLMTLLHIGELIKDGSPLVEIEREVHERIAYTYGDEELARQGLDLYEEQIAAPAQEEETQ